MIRRCGSVGCQSRFLIGLYWINIQRGRRLVRSHIHAVHGVLSSRVAHNVPSALKVNMPMPCFMSPVSFLSKAAFGGVTGC
jgi:hypothetical protein